MPQEVEELETQDALVPKAEHLSNNLYLCNLSICKYPELTAACRPFVKCDPLTQKDSLVPTKDQ